MKTRNAIGLTLAGILGLFGGAKLASDADSIVRESSKIIPARVYQISEQEQELRIKYGNCSFHYIAIEPEFQEAVNKYRSLIEEKKTYLNDPNIANAVNERDKVGFMRAKAVGLSIPSMVALLGGVLGLPYWKRIK